MNPATSIVQGDIRFGCVQRGKLKRRLGMTYDEFKRRLASQLAAANESDDGILVSIELDLGLREFAANNPNSLKQVRVDLAEQNGDAPAVGNEKSTDVPTETFRLARKFGSPVIRDRYEFRERLGEGSFGEVYRAWDSDLTRDVAIKVSKKDRLSGQIAIDSYYGEAKAAASLQHPSIVTIHDVQQSDGQVFIIQEFVDGGNLAKFCEPGNDEAFVVDLFAQLLEAISVAHQQGWIHCDLKPANILLDKKGRIRIADFGLALHESTVSEHRGEVAGTANYMAPEQIRGESHRFSGETDIWSLGVIFYQLLVGQRPFNGRTRSEIFENILERDPKPPRQINPSCSPALQRICLRCLSKYKTDRYPSAADVLDDLSHWRATSEIVSSSSVDQEIVFRGLRSYEQEDAFFLDLLPGARDRDGFPPQVRFIKNCLEQFDSSQARPVVLVSGPSGSGKSSLIKAGVIPYLCSSVRAKYIDALAYTPDSALKRYLADLSESADGEWLLSDRLRAVRHGLPHNEKVVLIIDQFEQWLKMDSDTFAELRDALRQCDGAKLQRS